MRLPYSPPPLSLRQLPCDLDTMNEQDAICAREPIRTPGTIQPHGVLLGVAPDADLRVAVASSNAAELLGVAPLGKPLDQLFRGDFVADLRLQVVASEATGASPWETTIVAQNGRPALEVSVHLHSGLILIELEPVLTEDAQEVWASTRLLQRWIGRLRNSNIGGVTTLAELAAQAIRDITGYERVLIYRFDADWNGQAIAEDKAEDWLQSLNGLHFPASDIPRQARELYCQNLLRWVPDRDYTPVPLITAPGWPPGSFVDLSFAKLRSLSPIHLQYHRNMGLNGSMSLSVLRGDQLWGLVVCHHRRPHRVSADRRAAAAALTEAFALRLDPAEREETQQARRADMLRMKQLLTHMATAEDVATALVSGPVSIVALFDVVGAVVVYGGTMTSVGLTPPNADLQILVTWLRERPEQEVFQTAHLATDYPPFAPYAQFASGLLAVFLTQTRSDMLLWFRPEEPQTVSWGGDPRTPVDANASHQVPRASFERWVEIRHGYARPWADWELEMAATLRHAITEVIIRSLHHVAELNERLRQSQKMEAIGQLTGGLAHDFNNLLTAINGSLEMLNTRLAQGRFETASRYIQTAQGAAKRAAALIHRLLAFSRQQPLDPKPINATRLITDMADLIQRLVGSEIKLETVTGIGLWSILCDPNQLENALLNLCINARDAMPEGGKITIETANAWIDDRGAHQRDISEGQYVAVCVSDTGSGMSPEVVARAFDPFFTTKPVGQGTGLGLSMIYGFAKQSNGQIRIYSKPGEGTTMRLYLPRYCGDAEVKDAEYDSVEVPQNKQGQKALVVDDGISLLHLITEAPRSMDTQPLE